MRLLDLPTGRVSLELEPTEVSDAIGQLGSLGTVTREPHATHEIVAAGPFRFIHMNDWDEPCLLSLDRTGDLVLRAIGSGLSATAWRGMGGPMQAAG